MSERCTKKKKMENKKYRNLKMFTLISYKYLKILQNLIKIDQFKNALKQDMIVYMFPLADQTAGPNELFLTLLGSLGVTYEKNQFFSFFSIVFLFNGQCRASQYMQLENLSYMFNINQRKTKNKMILFLIKTKLQNKLL